MRKELLAMLVSMVCLILVAGCDTEAGYRDDRTAPPPSEARPEEPVPGQPPAGAPGEPPAGAGAARGAEQGAAALGSYQEWDTDRSGDVTQSEFESRFRTFPGFTRWDRNSDGRLDESEAAHLQWSLFDADRDGRLDENEWTDGVEAMGLEADYAAADRDGDGKIGQAEFTRWFRDNAWSEWDGDGNGQVEREEAAGMLWQMLDGNDDDKVEQDEWTEAVRV